MPQDAFFSEAREQSRVKTAIISKYFFAWAKVIIPSAKKGEGKLAYIDLFAGPGRYGDGTKSTPLLILEEAIADSNLRNMLVSIFNDGEPEHSPTDRRSNQAPRLSSAARESSSS